VGVDSIEMKKEEDKKLHHGQNDVGELQESGHKKHGLHDIRARRPAKLLSKVGK